MIARDDVVDALVEASDACWPTLSRERRDRFLEIGGRLHAWVSDFDGPVHADCERAADVVDEEDVEEATIAWAISEVLKPLVDEGRLDRDLGREIATKMRTR